MPARLNLGSQSSHRTDSTQQLTLKHAWIILKKRITPGCPPSGGSARVDAYHAVNIETPFLQEKNDVPG